LVKIYDKIYDKILSTVYIGKASQAVSPKRWNVMAKSKLIIAKIDHFMQQVWDKILHTMFIGKFYWAIYFLYRKFGFKIVRVCPDRFQMCLS
jgi:hypothetical protein